MPRLAWLLVRDPTGLDDDDLALLVAEYHQQAGGFDEPVVEERLPATWRDDPLWAVWARRVQS